MGAWLSSPESFELGTDGPSTVVVGIDGSPSSLRALAYAVGFARRNGGTLVAVHVRAPGGPTFNWTSYCVPGVAGLVAQSAWETQDAIEAELHAEATQLSRAWGIRIRLIICEGDRLKELAAVADEHHADAVIVGASSRIGSRVAGSLAVRLVRRRNWPVTVVP